MKILKKLKDKFIRNIYSKKIRKTLIKVLEEYFSRKINLILKGAKGKDFIFQVLDNEKIIAIVRYSLDSNLSKKNKYNNLPYIKLSAKETLLREYNIYNELYKIKLAPMPRFYSEKNNLLCNDYIDGEIFFHKLISSKERFWEYVMLVSKRITLLHKQNITHMDMSFNNILIDKKENIYFIDFEYAPNNITFHEQTIYDYLRLIESVYKFIPSEIFEQENKIEKYFKYLDNTLEDSSKNIPFSNLEKALSRILNNKLFKIHLKKIFKNIKD